MIIFKTPALFLLLIMAGVVIYFTYIYRDYRFDPQPPSVPQIPQSLDILKDEFIVAAAGDISCGDRSNSDGQCQDKQTAELIDNINPDLVLALGDLQYSGASLELFNKYYDQSWGTFKEITRPALGNHEYENTGAQGYFDYFQNVAGDQGGGYYSFDLGKWHLVSLNSNCWAVGGCGSNSKQYLWLQQDLEKNSTQCSLVYYHHPLFSSGQHGPNQDMRQIWELMDKSGVDVVLSGHDHLYERFSTQDSQGRFDPNGIKQFTVGTGGRNLYRFVRIMPNSEFRDSQNFGVLKLTLKPTEYNWEFRSIQDKVLDFGAATCK